MHRLIAVILICGCFCVFTGHAQGQVPKQPAAVITEIETSFVELTEQIKPFVVNIRAKRTSSEPSVDTRNFNELFRYFGIPLPDNGGRGPRPVQTALGSGFIYDKTGHIITNNHMVEDATDVTVTMWDGTEYPATIVGRDPDTDLAVVKIEPKTDLPVAPLGESDTLKVGQFAIACGSPQGLQGTFTFGHISALRRNELDLPGLRFENFIQTDAPINVGNSGGPLCDAHGRVIGINVAIVYGANALGFAIPIDTAATVVPALISQGRVVRGFLGVGVRDARLFAEPLELPDPNGAFVISVQDDSPAEEAGIRPYDVIRKVNDIEIKTASDMVTTVSQFKPDTRVKLEIWRDGKIVSAEAKLKEYQEQSEQKTPEQGEGPSGTDSQSLGVRVAPITPDLREQLQLDADTEGAVIIDMNPGSPAAEAGLQPGDVITEINKEKVRGPKDLGRLVSEHAKPGRTVLVGVVRRGQHEITVVHIPAAEQAPK